MTRFSRAFGKDVSQAELDFVDIDLDIDNHFYLDPYAIQIRKDDWSVSCGDQINSFFNAVLDALRAGDDDRAERLFSQLHEPNETFLGQSNGQPRGRGVGQGKADDFLSALKQSRAFHTGVLSDISEAELFIYGVGPDTISDLTTNVCRNKLSQYTKRQCVLHNIPTREVRSLGPEWDLNALDWKASTYELPTYLGNPILLVPKFSVRLSLSLKSQEFWNAHMIEFLRQDYLSKDSPLVKTFKKDGGRYVTKKSVKLKHPFAKDDLADFVRQHPYVLDTYKKLKINVGPLSIEEIDIEFDEKLFCELVSRRLEEIPPGNKHANEYHSLAMGICTFLFYPQIIDPVKEHDIHSGRKRIDIKFTNASESGFFHRMGNRPQTRSIHVMVECKNYSKDLANPEFDQMTSRFSHKRGRFGIILCRTLEDRTRSLEACRDAASDDRGYMIIFEDKDLYHMLDLVKVGKRSELDAFLQLHFDEILG